MKAGRTVDQAAAEYKVPTTFKGYIASINPAFAGVSSNLKIAHTELGEK
jgi:hypothetical protein